MSVLKVKYKNPDLEDGLEVSVADMAMAVNGGDYVDIDDNMQAQYEAANGVKLEDAIAENPHLSIRGVKKEDETPGEKRARENSGIAADVAEAQRVASSFAADEVGVEAPPAPAEGGDK